MFLTLRQLLDAADWATIQTLVICFQATQASEVNTGHKSRYSSDWIEEGRINRRFFLADFSSRIFPLQISFRIAPVGAQDLDEIQPYGITAMMA